MNESIEKSQSDSDDLYGSAILAEQVSQLYAALTNTIIATTINASILVFVLWPVIEQKVLLIWLIVLLLISLARGFNSYQYRTANPQPENAYTWYRRFSIGSLMSSVVWGSSSIWLFVTDNLIYQLFLVFVVGGMAAGAVTSLSPVKTLVYSYLGLTLTPLIFRFYYIGSELEIAMGTMGAIYLVMLLSSANRTNATIKQNIKLRIEAIEQTRVLRQKDDHYKTLLETARDSFFLSDLQENIVDVNNQACLSLGYTHDELLNMSVTDIDVGSSPKTLNQLWGKLEKGEHIHIESIQRRKDGTTFPVEISLSLMQIDGRGLISAFVRDITIRKQNEEYIRDSQQRMALHVQSTPLGVIEWDKDFCVVEWNPAAEEIFGYTRDEALGCKTKDFIVPETLLDHVDDIWSQLITSQGGLRSTNDNLTKDKKVITCNWFNTPLRNDEGEVIGVASLVQDITEIKQAQEKLKISEMRFRHTLDQAPALIWITDKDNKGIWYNRRWLEYTGRTMVQELGFGWAEGIHPDDKERCVTFCQNALDEEQRFEMELRLLREDGTYGWIVDIGIPSYDGDGQFEGYIGYCWDITDRKQAVQSIIDARDEAEKSNAAKSEFLSRMSHELRTPMNAILGFSQVLELDSDEFNDTQKSNIKEILNAGHHLLYLINEVLDLSKIESGNLEISNEDVHISDVIQQCLILIKPQIDEHHLKLIDRISDKDHRVHTDFTRLKQVLLNLLTNSVKYNSEQGSITLDSEIIDNQRLRIYITDCGNGLSKPDIEKLFTPFERLNVVDNVEGAGIGLVITKHLIELMGGSIGIDSTVGEGSTFWVELLLAKNPHKRK